MSLSPVPTKSDPACKHKACQSMSGRNGKVARLPLAMRKEITRLLDDGIPYKIIIEKLGEPGKHLNEDNLSNWRLGGYQDYLRALVISDRARHQTEAAADVVRDNGHADPAQLQRACQEITPLHYFTTLPHPGHH